MYAGLPAIEQALREPGSTEEIRLRRIVSGKVKVTVHDVAQSLLSRCVDCGLRLQANGRASDRSRTVEVGEAKGYALGSMLAETAAAIRDRGLQSQPPGRPLARSAGLEPVSDCSTTCC